MVEGANIFITATARKHLEDAGLVVIKDSSANKGGVICSSYEVLAGLVLSEDEFIARKPRYVNETIALLRARADAEGRALIAAWKRRSHEVRLSELSEQISDEINRVSGLLEPVIEAHLDDAAFAGAWTRHLHRHCPSILVEEFADRLATRIPRAHRVAILAKRLASLMVYREGLTWVRAYLTAERVWQVLSTWLDAEEKVARAVAAVQRLGLPDGDELTRIISAGSQRELVRERLGQEF
jgi:glutamate dehydrogenase